MPSRLLLVFLVLPAVACTPSPYTVNQHGLISTPRPASYDGQPMPTKTRLEGHGGTSRLSNANHTPESGAAVARHNAGGALRMSINPTTDVGIELDGAWGKSAETLSGDNSTSIGVVDAPVIDGALAVRHSMPVDGRFRVGVAVAMGLSSSPIHRDGSGDGAYGRDSSFLVRAAVVPSYRIDNVTLYGSVGTATQSSITESFEVVPSEWDSNDPGVVAETKQLVLTAAAGATIQVGKGTQLTAQVGQAWGREATFGPQVMAGVAFDLGEPAGR